MKIYKVLVSKKELESLPEIELNFFIQACRMLNEINILHKITTFSNKESKSDAERRAQNSQSLSLLTILAGKLYEGWVLLEKIYFGAKLSKAYHSLLPSEAVNSLNNLKFYFGKSDNLVKKVRNQIAFHYDSLEILEQFRKAPQDQVFEIYLSEYQGNCCYFMSNVLLLDAILEWTGISDPLKATDTFFKEVLSAARWFIEFLNHCLVTFAKNNIEWDLEEIEIPDPPNIAEVAIPYFVAKPK